MLLSLPQELRDQIYSYLIPANPWSTGIKLAHNDNPSIYTLWRRTEGLPPGVCKQLELEYREAVVRTYKPTTLEIHPENTDSNAPNELRTIDDLENLWFMKSAHQVTVRAVWAVQRCATNHLQIPSMARSVQALLKKFGKHCHQNARVTLHLTLGFPGQDPLNGVPISKEMRQFMMLNPEPFGGPGYLVSRFQLACRRYHLNNFWLRREDWSERLGIYTVIWEKVPMRWDDENDKWISELDYAEWHSSEEVSKL